MGQLGDVIRQRCRGRGLTQAAGAERTGVHVRQIRRYETGEQQPVLAVAARLAATLEVSLDELAGLAGAVLDGEWWAARQVRIDGHDVTVALPVRLTQHGTTIELHGLEPGRGDVRSRGTMLLVLHEGGTVAEGRWVGLASDGTVVTGAAALARTRARAEQRLGAAST
jgi:transcriptional regulator with XRE-family HTH domain